MSTSLDGKVIIVTGASRGIGIGAAAQACDVSDYAAIEALVIATASASAGWTR
jgi:NAD(P)-dependent dehydrogenase (short-subunit alcohol dehydrogenase family)